MTAYSNRPKRQRVPSIAIYSEKLLVPKRGVDIEPDFFRIIVKTESFRLSRQ